MRDALSFVASDANAGVTVGNTAKVEFWRRIAPADGPQTVTVSLDGASKVVCGGSVWRNVDQTTPLGAATASHADTGAPAITLPGVVITDVVHDFVSVAGPVVAAPTAGQTSLWNVQVNIGGNNMTGMGGSKSRQFRQRADVVVRGAVDECVRDARRRDPPRAIRDGDADEHADGDLTDTPTATATNTPLPDGDADGVPDSLGQLPGRRRTRTS